MQFKKSFLGICAVCLLMGTSSQVLANEGSAEIRNVDGTLFYYENGKLNTQKYGFVTADDLTVLVAKGKVLVEAEGLVQDPEHSNDWYYLAGGRVQKQHTGLAMYDGAWFYVENGKLNTKLSDFVSYDGGLFYVGAGRIMKEVNGLAQDPNGTDWYYLANGQAQTQYTGLAFYDEEWFYVIEGKLAEDYTGMVTYDGSEFYVVNGMVKNNSGNVNTAPDTDNKQDMETDTETDTETTPDKEVENVENIFSILPSEFWFSSGAGGWGTVLRIAEDGTFTGQYHDSDMGETGEGYPNGTVYISNFSGKFSTPEKVNEYSYVMDLEELKQEGTKGMVYYEDGTKYIVTTPYGMQDVSKCYIYLPGAPIAKLPERFLYWSGLNEEMYDTLPEGYYGFYNSLEATGFVGSKKEN